MIRTAGKTLLEPMTIATGINRLGRWLRRGRGVVLAYHKHRPRLGSARRRSRSLHLAGDALQKEVSRPRDWLRQRFGNRYVDLLSYPYGLHCAPVRRAARSAGYLAGFALEPGSVPVAAMPHSSPGAFSLPRLNVPAGLSIQGLRVRTAWA